jgi:hypothetical protein
LLLRLAALELRSFLHHPTLALFLVLWSPSVMRFWFPQTSRVSKTSDERISDRALVQRRGGRDLSHCGGQGRLEK